MLSLMPIIPITTPAATLIRDKRRNYTLEELSQFPTEVLTTKEIRAELNYLKDEKDYRGPRTFTRVADGRALLATPRDVSAVPLDQRPQATPTDVVGLNTTTQVLPEGATVVRRPGEVPRLPDLEADRPSATRAALKPDLVAPWTEWNDNNPKGEALPSRTLDEKALCKQLKKQIAKWLEDDRHTRQQADQIGAIRSTSEAYVSLLRSMWRLGLGRNERDLIGWNWGSQTYSDAQRKGRWTREHVDRLVCWIT